MLRVLRDQRGIFTIMDLLLIMAVLSILVYGLLPHQEIVVDEAKVLQLVEDLQILEKALLKFYADLGAWPANNQPSPFPGLADIDLYGGNSEQGCGGSDNTENATSNDAALLCQGNTQGELFQMGSNGSFDTVDPRFLIRKWKGPYINREKKNNPFGGSYILNFVDMGTRVPGANAFCRHNAASTTNCQDVVLEACNIPLPKQVWADRLLDDGNLTTGRLQGLFSGQPQITPGTCLRYAVAVF